MRHIFYSVAFLLLILPFKLLAQQGMGEIKGTVSGKNEKGNIVPLVGANVFWLGTSKGTVTNNKGKYSLDKTEETSKLVVSFIGYQPDTIDVSGKENISVALSASVSLEEVEINYRKRATEISRIDPIKVEKISEKELQKAACCNLSESFETNPSVDVSFTDAITGTRQIQMLGLAGPNIQITRENMPNIRGLSAVYGLTYIPGHWIESIQLNKGNGSVVNGYESIVGQINTELRKPETADPVYLNFYANESSRIEGNANLSRRFENSGWSTALLLHGKNQSVRWDKNNDGFMDSPVGNNLIGLNRWKFSGDNGLRFQLGLKGTYIDKIGGELDFEADNGSSGNADSLWGMQHKTERYEGWAKIGLIDNELPWRSAALQVSGVEHIHESNYGYTRYDASQRSLYTNFIYQSIIGNTQHVFKTGASFQYDRYSEMLDSNVFDRTEAVPGVYFEYTYKPNDNFTAVAGGRVDYHNLYGAFTTPRLHLRYAVTESMVMRFSAGRGLRTPSIIAENFGLLASSRQIVIESEDQDKPYGLDQEKAWNVGINITQFFQLDYRDGSISLDFYRTDFQNQIVVDLDRDPQQVVFYNLQGKSYSNSVQAQLDYELIKRLDMRLAYRMYDVRKTYSGELKRKPLLSTHRAFVNMGYETRNHWRFDYTLNWQGSKRIPYTGSNPPEYQLADNSPSFVLMNAQISKTWNERIEVYVGVENLLGYKQQDPILGNEDPLINPHFDGSLIWGPVFGRKTYVGLRIKFNKKEHDHH